MSLINLQDKRSEADRTALRLRRTRRRPGSVDVAIGAVVRRQRAAVGLSQGELAGMLGVTPQQVHKYEAGACKMDAGRLFEICRLLGVEIAEVEAEVMNGDGHPDSPTKMPSMRAKLEMAKLCARIEVHKMHALLQVARALSPEKEMESVGQP